MVLWPAKLTHGWWAVPEYIRAHHTEHLQEVTRLEWEKAVWFDSSRLAGGQITIHNFF